MMAESSLRNDSCIQILGMHAGEIASIDGRMSLRCKQLRNGQRVLLFDRIPMQSCESMSINRDHAKSRRTNSRLI